MKKELVSSVLQMKIRSILYDVEWGSVCWHDHRADKSHIGKFTVEAKNCYLKVIKLVYPLWF